MENTPDYPKDRTKNWTKDAQGRWFYPQETPTPHGYETRPIYQETSSVNEAAPTTEEHTEP